MGMFGNRAGLSAAQQIARGGDGVDPNTARPMAFEQGGVGRNIAGYIGDALLNIGGQKPVFGPAVQNQREQESMLQRQLLLAQYKQQNPDPTGTMQNAAAAGTRPGTPEYQALIRQTMLTPHYMTLGNPETGQTVIDPSQMGGGQGSIDPAAIARLKANPGEAAMFDEHFGPGSAATILGAQ